MLWTITYHSDRLLAWVDDLPVGIRASYARITERMQSHGPALGMPYTRAMGDGLFEVRARGREGIARVFYCTVVGRSIVMLHGFVKRTGKTPARELALARQRMKEVKRENA